MKQKTPFVADLHCHTNKSDGAATPQEVIKFASEKSLRAVSIVDHNRFTTLDHPTSWREDDINNRLLVIQGIEISTTFKSKSMHILGYSRNFRPSKSFISALERLHANYVNRGKRILAKMSSLGYEVSMDEIKGSGASYAHRNAIADVAMRKYGGKRSDWLKIKVQEDDFFMNTTSAIDYVHNASGIAILAHPGEVINQYGFDDALLLIDEFFASGLDGIEVSHPSNDNSETRKLVSMLRKSRKDILIAGGSDSHDKNCERMGQWGLQPTELEDFMSKIVS